MKKELLSFKSCQTNQIASICEGKQTNWSDTHFDLTYLEIIPIVMVDLMRNRKQYLKHVVTVH